MLPYALSLEARQDLHDIRAYYLKEANARVSRFVLREITRNFRLLAANPGIGHLRPDLTCEPMKFWQVLSYLIVYDPAMRHRHCPRGSCKSGFGDGVSEESAARF